MFYARSFLMGAKQLYSIIERKSIKQHLVVGFINCSRKWLIGWKVREHVRWQHFSQKKRLSNWLVCPIPWFVQLKMQQAMTGASAATSKLMVSHLKDGQPIAMV